jgi:hypothetical protein
MLGLNPQNLSQKSLNHKPLKLNSQFAPLGENQNGQDQDIQLRNLEASGKEK